MNSFEFSLLHSFKRRTQELLSKRKPLSGDKKAIAARLKHFRAGYLKCLGYLPDPTTPLNPKTEETVVLDEGIIQERVIYFTEPDVPVPAHVYRPADQKGPLPGILLIQGWDLDKYSLHQAKIALAQAGYVVLFPDNRCSGERSQINNQTNLAPVANLLGMTFLGMNTFDNMRALDYLSSREDVQGDRLACIGLCWGGMQCYNLAALDSRVKVACPVCGVSTYEALVLDYSFRGGHSCLGTYIPGLLEYGDVQDIMALIAPRPLLIQNNVNDAWFPVSGYLKIKKELEKVYHAFGCPEKFQAHITSTVHDITPEFTARILDFLKQTL